MSGYKREPKDFSIVIPSWFRSGQDGKYGRDETYWFAQECLDRMLECIPRDRCEVIIVDNGSTLGETEHGDPNVSYFPKCDILVRNSENLGFAAGCNQGFAVANGKYVVCMNNDILVWPGWLEAMEKDFAVDKGGKPTGVLMPALMKQTGDAREALAMTEIDLTQNAGKFAVGAEFGSLWMAERQLLRELAKRRDGYQVLDEGFVNGKEDRLLWMEVRLEGLETYRTHNTRVFHQGQMSCGKTKDRRDFSESNSSRLEEMKKKYGVG